MLSVVVIVTCVMLPLSIWLLIRSPFNVAAITAVLTWVFGVIPAIQFLSSGVVVSYSWRTFIFAGGPLPNPHESMETLILLCLMGSGFTLGSLIALAVMKPPAHQIAAPHPTSNVTTIAMAGLWAFSAFYFFDLSGANFGNFLLPEKEAYQTSGYLEVVFIMMPLAIALKLYWAKGRLDIWSVLWLTLAILATFSRHQRRDLITATFFIMGMLVLVGEIMRRPKNAQAHAVKRARLGSKHLTGLVLLGLGAALVPLLWYARVYATSSVDSTQIRGFNEILFGSPATGFPTLAVIRDYVLRTGTHLLHMPNYIGRAIMPDGYWPWYAKDLDGIIQQYYRLPENPSAFWFGELYFALGSMAIPAAFVLGLITFWLSQAANTSTSLLARSLGLIAFMQTMTFYKNGISVFAINSIAISAFVLFAWFMPKLWDAPKSAHAIPITRLRAMRARQPALETAGNSGQEQAAVWQESPVLKPQSGA